MWLLYNPAPEMELTDEELFQVISEVNRTHRSNSQIRPVNRHSTKAPPQPLQYKHIPHVLKVLEETKQLAETRAFT